MRALRGGIPSLLAGALLLSALPSFAQKSLGITAVQLASDFRQEAGKRLTFVCPASDGAKAVVHGTETYADFSMICPAAIHAGVLKPGRAGVVSIVLGLGATSFEGSQRNGVTSEKYGRWDYSFTFARDAAPGEIAWTTGWSQIPAGFAEPVVVACPAGGKADAYVWGTDIYTADSAICVAAVHAGVITAETGGKVSVTRTSGLKVYAATERNRVASRSWGAVADAFSVKTGAPPAGGGSSGSGTAARTIALAGFTASGAQAVSGPRTIALAGFTAVGSAPPAGPRTITLAGWTAAGP